MADADADSAPPPKRPRMQRRKSSVLLAHERAGLLGGASALKEFGDRPCVDSPGREWVDAFGAHGGFVGCSRQLKQLLLTKGRPGVFSFVSRPPKEFCRGI